MLTSLYTLGLTVPFLPILGRRLSDSIVLEHCVESIFLLADR